MAKGTSYLCSACGWRTSKWVGRCPSCGEWGSLTETAEPVGRRRSAGAAVSAASGAGALAASVAATPITGIEAGAAKAVPTGIGELDRVLGRGVVPGSVVLLAGEPGVGKSTLLLEVAHRCAAGELGPALYVTGEESVGQVRLRAERTGALHDDLYLAAESDVDEVIAQAMAVKPGLMVVDSVQTMRAAGVEGTHGGVAQARAVTAALTALAKESGTAILLVGHVTKDGTVAGPRTMEHLVDVVLNFEGDRHSGLRFLRGLKNRFGATDEVGCFEQTAEGIREVEDPSGLFLHHRTPTPGTAVTVAMEGRRPMLAEVQGLIVEGEAKGPRRNVSGLDQRRVPMVAAVVARHCGAAAKQLAQREIYMATVGGMTLVEPAADLAVAVALVSAQRERAVRDGVVLIGELGLAGEVRRVTDLALRLKEAGRMGFTHAVVPAGTDAALAPAGLRLVPARTVAEAVEACLGSGRASQS